MRSKAFKGVQYENVVSDPYFPVYREELKLNNGTPTGVDALYSDTRFFGTVSKQYILLEHKEASNIATNMLDKLGIKYDISTSIATGGGAKFFQTIKFPDYKFSLGDVENTAEGNKNRDDFIPTVILKNSYDKTCAFQFIYGGFRMVCMNGLVVGDVVQNISYVHTKQINTDYIGKVFQTNLEKTIEGIRFGYNRLNTEECTPYVKLLLAEIFTKNMVGEVINMLPDGSFENDDNNLEISPDISAYMLYNIITNVITHKVKSVNRQIELGNKIAKIFRI